MRGKKWEKCKYMSCEYIMSAPAHHWLALKCPFLFTVAMKDKNKTDDWGQKLPRESEGLALNPKLLSKSMYYETSD